VKKKISLWCLSILKLRRSPKKKAPYEEGCLSVPSVYDVVDRPTKVRIEALNEQGEAFSLETDGLLAVCIQHELDHLEGKLFVDLFIELKTSTY
jgi:peptide deformylase